MAMDTTFGDYGKFGKNIGSMISNIIDNKGKSAAIDASKRVLKDTQNEVEDRYNEQGVQTQTAYQPYIAPGQGNLGKWGDFEIETPDAYDRAEFEFDFEASPGYQHILQEGQKELAAKAAADGSLYDGATMKGMAEFINNTAAQEYKDMYDRARGEYEYDETADRTQNNIEADRDIDVASKNYDILDNSVQTSVDATNSATSYDNQLFRDQTGDFLDLAGQEASLEAGEAYMPWGTISQGISDISGLGESGGQLYDSYLYNKKLNTKKEE